MHFLPSLLPSIPPPPPSLSLSLSSLLYLSFSLSHLAIKSMHEYIHESDEAIPLRVGTSVMAYERK